VRGIPQAEAWRQAYARYGLQIVGVHLPQFAFATDTAVAARSARRLGLDFPIVHDATLALWSAFGPHDAGPRFVLADAAGIVVLDTSGAESGPAVEDAIRRELLKSRPELRFPRDDLAERPRRDTPDAPAIVHLGTARVAGGPIATSTPGRPQHFTAQFRFQIEGRPFVPYPVGYWTPSAAGLTAARGGASEFVALRYHAPSLGAVLSPPASGPVRVWVLVDERWLAAGGADVRHDSRGSSYVLVDEPRLYAIWDGPRSEHVVKLSPEARGVTVHAFTFEPSTPAAPARP
jgi:hypothetical protein